MTHPSPEALKAARELPAGCPENLKAATLIDSAFAERCSDHEHALSEAKRRVPDYPWTQNTMSEVVWALGESLLGVQAACGDWQKRCERLESALDFYMRVCGNTGYAVSRESAREMYDFALAALKEHHS